MLWKDLTHASALPRHDTQRDTHISACTSDHAQTCTHCSTKHAVASSLRVVPRARTGDERWVVAQMVPHADERHVVVAQLCAASTQATCARMHAQCNNHQHATTTSAPPNEGHMSASENRPPARALDLGAWRRVRPPPGRARGSPGPPPWCLQVCARTPAARDPAAAARRRRWLWWRRLRRRRERRRTVRTSHPA